MNDNSEVLSRLVVGHKRDGRCQYDPLAKQELIRQCTKPGVSVSRIAMQHGVNANLLRAWIAKSLLQDTTGVQQTIQANKPIALPAFVAVQIEPTAKPALTMSADHVEHSQYSSPSPPVPVPSMRLHVRLPNAVTLDIDIGRLDDLTGVMQMLSALLRISVFVTTDSGRS